MVFGSGLICVYRAVILWRVGPQEPALARLRLFIERVLANLWIYRKRLGQPAPSLDGIASGDWPTYVALDTKTRELARKPNNVPN